MKSLFLLAVLFCCLYAVPACKKEEKRAAVITECLQIKFDEFKQLPGATKIVRINHPDGILYRLIQGNTVDEGEPVLNEQCELVCTADCECAASIFLCDGTFLDFPTETIWER